MAATASGSSSDDAAKRPVSNLNPANAITASRFLALPVFWWAVAHQEQQLALLAIMICAFLDVFDGLVARIFHYQTPFGEVFDGLTDGFCYAFFMGVAVGYGLAPLAPVVIIIAVGLINLWMRVRYAKRMGRTTNYRSFAMERLVGFAAYLTPLAVLGWSVSYYFWAFALINVVVVIHDAKRMLVDPVPAEPEQGDALPAGAIGGVP